MTKSTLSTNVTSSARTHASGDAVEAWLHRALCLIPYEISICAEEGSAAGTGALFFVRSQ